MNNGTAGYITKLVNDPSAEAETYTKPLLELMDIPIDSLYGPLLKANFLRFLELLWLHILDQITAATINSKSVGFSYLLPDCLFQPLVLLSRKKP